MNIMHKQRGSHFRFTAWKPLESPASAIHLQDPFRRARRTPGKNSLPGSRCPSVHGRSGHRARTPGHGVHRHTRRCRRTCGRIQEGSPGMRVRHDGTAYSRPSTSPGGHSFHPLSHGQAGIRSRAKKTSRASKISLRSVGKPA